MGEIVILLVAVVVFYLLWVLVDYVAGLLPKPAGAPALPLAAIGHIILIIAAVI